MVRRYFVMMTFGSSMVIATLWRLSETVVGDGTWAMAGCRDSVPDGKSASCVLYRNPDEGDPMTMRAYVTITFFFNLVRTFASLSETPEFPDGDLRFDGVCLAVLQPLLFFTFGFPLPPVFFVGWGFLLGRVKDFGMGILVVSVQSRAKKCLQRRKLLHLPRVGDAHEKSTDKLSVKEFRDRFCIQMANNSTRGSGPSAGVVQGIPPFHQDSTRLHSSQYHPGADGMQHHKHAVQPRPHAAGGVFSSIR
ncbi:hypothetical protein CK203_095608 [Vitis vinifera]|uniref:Uncharacterized protein n=1 Tax=Vitis vinifera TaxID=29760 RepID=A0A438FGT6_VITVI|nr:hypothetical protein CK203_095608 [Vitis vinifera]